MSAPSAKAHLSKKTIGLRFSGSHQISSLRYGAIPRSPSVHTVSSRRAARDSGAKRPTAHSQERPSGNGSRLCRATNSARSVSRYSLEERLPVSRVVLHAAHCVVDVRFYRMDRLRLLRHQKPNGPCSSNARVLARVGTGARLCHRAELLLQDLLPLGEGRSALRPKAQACCGGARRRS